VSLLELTDVEVTYHRSGRAPVRAVAGATLAVEPGEIVGLVGESGCGKSTLARAAVGLIAPSGGNIRFDGHEVVPLSRRARRRELLQLQMVFQDPYSSLNPRRRIGAQLADALSIQQLTSSAERPGQVRALLDQVGLESARLESYPHQFSGGQRQRLAIARALAASPRALVLDEPLSSLDASAQAQVANLLQSLSRELGIAMLLISHDLAIVRQVASRISVMYLGEIVETGPTDDVWSAPLHPYSQALIAAVPRADGEGTRPVPLPGEVPDPARPASGCRFHPRCPHVLDRCRSETPRLAEIAAGRFAACWLQEPGAPVVLESAAVLAPLDASRDVGSAGHQQSPPPAPDDHRTPTTGDEPPHETARG
jgi:peptide/nickel transport system ATP-binding protein